MKVYKRQLIDKFVHCHMNMWYPCMKGLVAVKCAMVVGFDTKAPLQL